MCKSKTVDPSDAVGLVRLTRRSTNVLPHFLHFTLLPLYSAGAFSLAEQRGHSTFGMDAALLEVVENHGDDRKAISLTQPFPGTPSKDPFAGMSIASPNAFVQKIALIPKKKTSGRRL
jgi:hypothetical protein